jgi:hypothetical protein
MTPRGAAERARGTGEEEAEKWNKVVRAAGIRPQ